VNKDVNLTPAPGITTQAADPPLEMTLHPPSADTTATTEPGHESVLSPVFITSRENTVGINGSTRLHCIHGLPLHHVEVTNVGSQYWVLSKTTM
jgi:hypothetical protein